MHKRSGYRNGVLIYPVSVVDHKKEAEEGGGGGGGQPGPNTVGTEQIIDGAVIMDDLNDSVKDKMTNTYDEGNERMTLGNVVHTNQSMSTAPTTPSAPIVVEEEEEP